MFDRWAGKTISPMVKGMATPFIKLKVSPDLITFTGFLFGIVAAVMIGVGEFNWAIVMIVINRLADGIDGAVARELKPTERGGFLDIVLDFLFYSMIPLAFLIYDPIRNAVPAGVLIFSFVGTGTSFLAFAIIAEKFKIDKIKFPNKSFYYLGGIAEGTETIICLILFCIFPQSFPLIASIFAGICLLTTVIRTISGYLTIKSYEN